MSRITLNGERVHFSTRLSVDPQQWEVHQGRVSGRSLAAQSLNEKLEKIRFRVELCYNQLMAERHCPTPQAVKDRYMGNDATPKYLLTFFRRHNEQFEQMVGVSRSQTTLYKYRCVYVHLEKFVSAYHKRADISFDELNSGFLIAFHRYLVQNVDCKKNTAWVYLIAFKHILMLARSEGYLTCDIFANYKLRNEQAHRAFLTDSELRQIMQLPLQDKTQQLVRDAFVFSAFTGLSYVDLRALTPQQISGRNGQRWIITRRRKTGTNLTVRLFEVPCRILKQYSSSDPAARIFPLPVNSWCNQLLDRMAKLVGITGQMTFHTARHTFATTITLSQGMSIETISKLLGHTNIRTTQIYASVTHAKLNQDMEQLSKRINQLYQ